MAGPFAAGPLCMQGEQAEAFLAGLSRRAVMGDDPGFENAFGREQQLGRKRVSVPPPRSAARQWHQVSHYPVGHGLI